MRNLRHLFDSIPTGCRWLLAFLTLLTITSILLKSFLMTDLGDYLSLSGRDFWSGQVWRLLTHSWFPAGIQDLVLNSVLIAVVGAWVEARSTRWLFYGICLSGGVGSGVVKILLQPHDPIGILGIAPISFALLAAWIKVCGHEDITLIVTGVTKVRTAGIIFSLLSLVAAIFSCSPVNGLITACAWPAAWMFISCHEWYLRGRPSQASRSDRINRLEL